MALVIGIRHARVENPDGVVYARLPGFHLSAGGREEAERLGRMLAPVPVRAVYASPLERAAETAAALAAPHGLEVSTDERLIEWAFWVRWAGESWLTMRERHPEEMARYAEDPIGACPEDPADRMGERVLSWALEASAAHGEGVVLGVSHEAPLAAAVLVGRGQGFDAFGSVDVPHLAGVRLVPGPPEMVDLSRLVDVC